MEAAWVVGSPVGLWPAPRSSRTDGSGNRRYRSATKGSGGRARSRLDASSAVETPEPNSAETAPETVTQVLYTSLESNSSIIELARGDVAPLRVFVDPWLVGTLQFFTPKFYEARKDAIGDDSSVSDYGPCDLIVISQSLPDHLHMPTLRAMDKSIPVVCDAASEPILRNLGFHSVTPLDHPDFDSTTAFDGALTIQATPGALVGPPWSKRKNAYVFETQVGAGAGGRPFRLFYEPHADPGLTSLERVGTVDAILTPVVYANIRLPGGYVYPLVRGGEDAVRVARRLGVSKLVVLRNSTTEGRGMLDSMLEISGTVEEFREQMGRKGLGSVELVEPEFFESVVIAP